MDDSGTVVALVTGGSRGIGREICLELARGGMSIRFTYMSGREAAEGVLVRLREIHPGGDHRMARCDIADISSVKDALVELLAGDPPDVLVNNAGLTRDGLAATMSEDAWNGVLRTNLDGTFHVTRQVVLGMMRRKRGVILNVSSVSGVRGNAGQCNYAASKAGMIGFTLALSKELGPLGIRVNAVAPGFIETDMSAKVPEKDLKALVERTSLRRMGTASEVARCVRFLCEPASSYVTGAVLQIDGGMSL